MPTASLPAFMADNALPRILPRDQISARYAGLTRRIGRGLRLTLDDGVILHAGFTAQPAGDHAGALLLEGSHGSLYLEQGVPFLLALTGIDVSASDGAPPAQRTWLEASVLGRLAGSPLGMMTRLVRQPAYAPGPEQATLYLSLQDGSHAVSTLARADAACWHALLAASAWQAVCAPQSALSNLVVPLTARIARHALAPAMLRTLQPGDVILPAQPDVDVHGEGMLRSALWLARIRYGQAGTLEFLSLESAMETEIEPSISPQPDLDLDRTPLQLEFRLGDLALTLGQLRTVAPGAVFQLDSAADGAIAIVCGGQRLGQGEPVDVEGRLGIRITRWELPC